MKNLVLAAALLISAGLITSSVGDNPGKFVSAGHNRFKTPAETLQTGDVVVRAGKGFISDVFRKFSAAGLPWSHAGIVVRNGSNVSVFHLMGSTERSSDGIRIDPLDRFCQSSSNTGYAVYRLPGLADKETVIREFLKDLQSKNIRFDDHFNFADDRSMYCTEVIHKTYYHATGTGISLSEFKGEKYVSIDDILHHPGACKIAEQFYHP